MAGAKDTCGFFSGLSGLQLPVPKYLFPPEHQDSSRLSYYATFFNSIEINSTFYKLPQISTIVKWQEQVPGGFRFTFKLWKEITHNKGLVFKESDVELFFKVISGAGEKRGCVLIQFPPGLNNGGFLQLTKLMDSIARFNKSGAWQIAVEFRNRSWYNENTYQLLDMHRVALVIQDMPKSVTPNIDHKGAFIYLRFHGPQGNYRDSYTNDFLSEYSTYIREWLEDGKTVYTYFNNTMGDAFNNLKQLNNFCR